MTSCTNINLLKDNVNDFISYYEKALKSNELNQDEVASSEAALTRLYATKKAIDSNDREFLVANGFVNQRNKEKGEMFSSIFSQTIGKEFTFRYGRDGNTSKGSLIKAAPVEGGIAITINTRNGNEQYTIPSNSDGSSLPIEGSDRYIFISKIPEVLDAYEANLVDPDALEVVLGSDKTKLHLKAKYLQGDYVHGDKDSMKSTLEYLHLLGGSKATNEDLDYYKSLIDNMSEGFFDPLKLYVSSDEDSSRGNYSSSGRIDIAVNGSSRIVGNQQSEASIYMEEVLHSMTATAIESKTPAANKLKRQLAHTVEVARKTVKWEHFLPEESINPELEEAFAKTIYNYIFSEDNADHEFLAKGIAVPEVKKVFETIELKGPKKEKLLDRLNDLIALVIDIIRGNLVLKDKPKNVHESLMSLATSLGEINSKASKRKGRAVEGIIGHAMDIVNGMDDKVRVKLESARNWVVDKSDTKLTAMPDDYYGKVKWVADVLIKSTTNPTYRKVAGAVASAYGLKPDSTLREILGGLFATGPAQKAAEFLALQSGRVDKIRNTQIDIVRNSTFTMFKDKDAVTEQHEKGITSVFMDTGLSSLVGKNSVTVERGIRKVIYDNKTIRKLLTDKNALTKRINDVKAALKDYDIAHYEWHKNQAIGLGFFVATHKGTPEQNLNAYNIARGIHSGHKKAVNKNVVKAIDELASLQALTAISEDKKNLVAELMVNEWAGINHIVNMIEGFHQNSKELVFKNNQTNMIKGYSREIFDDSIVMEIAPISEKEKMEAQGFKLVNRLNPNAGDIRNKPMGLYVTYSASRPDRIRGAARLNQIRGRGQSIRNMPFVEDPEGLPQLMAERGKRDIINIQKAAIQRGRAMEKAGFSFDDSIYGVVPLLSNSGTVVDYRYMMDKETKEKLLKQDTRISEVLARSYGNILDKANTLEHNHQVLKELIKDMEENWGFDTVGKDGLTEFTLIGPKVETKEGKELFYMLPAEFQAYINNRHDKVLAVRTELKDLYFGYSNMSIANLFGMNKVNPAIVTKVIKIAEMWWMEAVKIVKGNTLLKLPPVLLGNTLVNFITAVMKGYNPVKLLALYTESYRDINTYNKSMKELQALENTVRNNAIALKTDILTQVRKAEIANENKKANQKIEAIKVRINRDLAHIEEIVKLGLDQNLDDSAEIDSNKITKILDEQLDRLPELVRSGIDIAFITKRTAMYKVANEFLEVSDLIARDVQNRMEKEIIEKQVNGLGKLPNWWLELQSKEYKPKQRLLGEERKQFLEMAKKQREYDLVEDFINYAKPSGRFEEYLNKIGILMFTKYVKRIQRIILKNSGNHPLKTALGLLAFGFIGGYPSIHESSFMVKDYYSDSLGAGNIFPIYAPTETFMNFITPAIVKDSTYELL